MVVADIFPLAGVLLFGWDLALVMVLFWLENVVVGSYAIVKMAVLARWQAVVLVPFFIVHFGGFSIVHLALLFVLFVGNTWSLMRGFLGDHAVVLFAMLAVLALSHGISLRDNFLRRERDALPTAPMFAAYRRVVILHVTLVLGALPVVALGEPRWALVLLTLLKVPADILSHVAEHRKASQPPLAGAGAPHTH